MKQQLFILISTLFLMQTGIAQSTDTFVDARDGQTYKTFSIKNSKTGKTVTWMAQNLNYKVQGSYAYDNNENNRKKFGLLYTWEAAKKACPEGWHLATDNEWAMLVSVFGGMDKAGEALKSVKGWDKDGNGTNSSGFNALPAGQRTLNGGYRVVGLLGFWWSSTLVDSKEKVWGWNLHFGGHTSDKPLKTKVFRWDVDTRYGSSVRCVRD